MDACRRKPNSTDSGSLEHRSEFPSVQKLPVVISNDCACTRACCVCKLQAHTVKFPTLEASNSSKCKKPKTRSPSRQLGASNTSKAYPVLSKPNIAMF